MGGPSPPSLSPPRVWAVVCAVVASGACWSARGGRPAPSLAPGVGDDPTASFQQRAAALVARMTLDEKVGQMVNAAPAIPRLGIPVYDWWSEALHGVARAGRATVFPQAIGLGATWDAALVQRVAVATADEARAKHQAGMRDGSSRRYHGLTVFAPCLNIARDPRWGRGQETYGEDPFLTGRLGVAFIRGLQGDDPRFLKVAAVAKHLAAHSGPERGRHGFAAEVSAHDLADTYLPQFEAAVREGGAQGIMAAYNRLNGRPAAANSFLLTDVLRGQWGFSGVVVSDCGAVDDIWRAHHAAASAEEAAALALRAGTDLSCGDSYLALGRAVRAGLVDEAAVDRALVRLFTLRFRLGQFDPPGAVPFQRIPPAVVDSAEHRALARAAAQESLVLLENRDGALPLPASARRLAVIGPSADDEDVLLGTYHGTPSRAVTLRAGIEGAARRRGIAVEYARGLPAGADALAGQATYAAVARALALAARADVVVLALGLSPAVQGEEGDAAGALEGDRADIDLPPAQDHLLRSIVATGKPVVLVLTGGGAFGLAWARAHVPAILMAFYPGEEGGAAVADVLFGDVSPSGRLPITFHESARVLPAFTDYGMAGRTYRYLRQRPVYAFGHGLSYTRFRYANLNVAGDAARIDVQNLGARPAAEVVQAYASATGAPVPAPRRWLVGFARVMLGPGEQRTVTIPLPASSFAVVDPAGKRGLHPGAYTLALGGRQPDDDGGYGGSGQGATVPVTITDGGVVVVASR